MRRINIIIVFASVLLILIACSKLQEQQEFKVSGKILQKSSYCGGAAPTEELLEGLEKEKPFANKKLYIKQGRVNTDIRIILEFQSDEQGNFRISLPEGTYCIIGEEFKKDKLNLAIFHNSPNLKVLDEQCLRELWKNCDKVLEVEETDIVDFVIDFNEKCLWDKYRHGGVPCVQYIGPLPP